MNNIHNIMLRATSVILVMSILMTGSSFAFEDPRGSALAPPLSSKPPCRIISLNGRFEVITNSDSIEYWNAQDPDGRFRNRWLFVDISYLAGQMLKIARDEKLESPKEILKDLMRKHIANRGGPESVHADGFDIDSIGESFKDGSIESFSIPVFARKSDGSYSKAVKTVLLYSLRKPDDIFGAAGIAPVKIDEDTVVYITAVPADEAGFIHPDVIAYLEGILRELELMRSSKTADKSEKKALKSACDIVISILADHHRNSLDPDTLIYRLGRLDSQLNILRLASGFRVYMAGYGLATEREPKKRTVKKQDKPQKPVISGEDVNFIKFYKYFATPAQAASLAEQAEDVLGRNPSLKEDAVFLHAIAKGFFVKSYRSKSKHYFEKMVKLEGESLEPMVYLCRIAVSENDLEQAKYYHERAAWFLNALHISHQWASTMLVFLEGEIDKMEHRSQTALWKYEKSLRMIARDAGLPEDGMQIEEVIRSIMDRGPLPHGEYGAGLRDSIHISSVYLSVYMNVLKKDFYGMSPVDRRSRVRTAVSVLRSIETRNARSGILNKAKSDISSLKYCLSDLNSLLVGSRNGGYVIPAFVGSFEDPGSELLVRSLIKSAMAEKTPIIILCYPDSLDRMGYGPGRFKEIVDRAKEELKPDVPVFVGLDHGEPSGQGRLNREDMIIQAINAGYDIVAIDGRYKELRVVSQDEAIRQVRYLSDRAHRKGALVEGVFGETGEPSDPAQAASFARKTGIDCMAISFGTVHGSRAGTAADLDLSLADRVAEYTDVPLACHGGSSLDNFSLSEMPAHGIAKLNIGTVLAKVARSARASYSKSPRGDEEDFISSALSNVIRAKMRHLRGPVDAPAGHFTAEEIARGDTGPAFWTGAGLYRSIAPKAELRIDADDIGNAQSLEDRIDRLREDAGLGETDIVLVSVSHPLRRGNAWRLSIFACPLDKIYDVLRNGDDVEKGRFNQTIEIDLDSRTVLFDYLWIAPGIRENGRFVSDLSQTQRHILEERFAGFGVLTTAQAYYPMMDMLKYYGGSLDDGTMAARQNDLPVSGIENLYALGLITGEQRDRLSAGNGINIDFVPAKLIYETLSENWSERGGGNALKAIVAHLGAKRHEMGNEVFDELLLDSTGINIRGTVKRRARAGAGEPNVAKDEERLKAIHLAAELQRIVVSPDDVRMRITAAGSLLALDQMNEYAVDYLTGILSDDGMSPMHVDAVLNLAEAARDNDRARASLVDNFISNKNYVMRREIVNKLSAISSEDERIMDLLGRAANEDQNGQVRLEAARGILMTEPHNDKALGAVREMMRSGEGDSPFRASKIMLSVDGGDEAALAVIKEEIKDPSGHLYFDAVSEVLSARSDDEDAIASLCGLLLSEGSSITEKERAAGALALAKTGSPDAISALEQAMGNTDLQRGIRLEAAKSLLSVKPDNHEAMAYIRGMLGDDNPHVRIVAAIAIAAYEPDDAEAINVLIDMLGCKIHARRRMAAEALCAASRHNRQAFNALSEMVSDDINWSVRHFALLAVRNIQGVDTLRDRVSGAIARQRGLSADIVKVIERYNGTIPEKGRIDPAVFLKSRAHQIFWSAAVLGEGYDAAGVLEAIITRLGPLGLNRFLNLMYSLNSRKDAVNLVSMFRDGVTYPRPENIETAPVVCRFGRSVVMPVDAEHASVIKLPRSGQDRTAFSYEARMMRDLRGLGVDTPEPAAEGSEAYMRYDCKLSYLDYVNEPLPWLSYEDRMDRLSGAATISVKDIASIHGSGFVHGSLIALYHDLQDSESFHLRSPHGVGGIAGINHGLRFPNIRVTGIADFEHIEASVELSDRQKNLFEWMLAIIHAGICCGISDEDIAVIVNASLAEYSGPLPEKLSSGMVASVRKSIAIEDSIRKDCHLPLLDIAMGCVRMKEDGITAPHDRPHGTAVLSAADRTDTHSESPMAISGEDELLARAMHDIEKELADDTRMWLGLKDAIKSCSISPQGVFLIRHFINTPGIRDVIFRIVRSRENANSVNGAMGELYHAKCIEDEGGNSVVSFGFSVNIEDNPLLESDILLRDESGRYKFAEVSCGLASGSDGVEGWIDRHVLRIKGDRSLSKGRKYRSFVKMALTKKGGDSLISQLVPQIGMTNAAALIRQLRSDNCSKRKADIMFTFPDIRRRYGEAIKARLERDFKGFECELRFFTPEIFVGRSGNLADPAGASAMHVREETRTASARFRDIIKTINAREDSDPQARKEPLILALGTSWIKGYARDESKHFAAVHGPDINRVITRLRSFCEENGVNFIVGEDYDLPGLIEEERRLSGESPDADSALVPKAIVLAGAKSVKSDMFKVLREDVKSSFVAGVNEVEITEKSYVPLVEMLSLVLRLSDSEVSPDSTTIPFVKDEALNIYILGTRPGPESYEEQKILYELQTFA